MNCSFCHNHDMFYARKSHNHDDRYYTESETDTLLAGKAPTVHTHDDRYYTESETDTLLAGKAPTVHTHDDRYYTESETDTLLAGKAPTSHTHDDRYYTESETNALLAGKSDTSHTHADASTTVKGLIELATQTEVNTGTDTVRAVTPATLKNATTKRIVGEVIMWPDAIISPAGWIMCVGTAISRLTYAELFAVIGTTFGAGNGSTTFNVPNFKDRFPVGAGTSYSVGGTGGEAAHTLTTAEIPSHAHTVYSSLNADTGTTRRQVNAGAGGDSDQQSGLTGGGGSHNNLPPYLGIGFIIYAGV